MSGSVWVVGHAKTWGDDSPVQGLVYRDREIARSVMTRGLAGRGFGECLCLAVVHLSAKFNSLVKLRSWLFVGRRISPKLHKRFSLETIGKCLLQ